MKEAAKAAAPDGQIQHLYLSFLGRTPTPAEAASTRAMLDKGLKTKDLCWVLLNTREFIFVQ